MNDKGIFMNIMTDYGFKRIFGTEQFKSVLIRFLNALFAKDGMVIYDVAFHDKEVLPDNPEGKRILYDVYCTTPDNKEHFILEMQQVHHLHLEKRMMYYVAKGVATQGIKGKKYDYSPVYGVFIVNFQFRHLARRIVNDFMMRERDTDTVFSNLMRLIVVCLEQTKSSWDECTTELEKTTYLIRNMHQLDMESKPYKSGEYDEMFDAAKLSNLAAEEAVAYRQSERYFLDRELYRESGYDEGKEEGRQEGRREGRQEGRQEGRREGRHEAVLETARKMKEAGFDSLVIKQITGLSPNEY